MKEKIYFIILGLVYFFTNKKREFFFQIIYGLSILELTIKLVKDKSGYLRKTIGLVLIIISLAFSYFAIKDPNPIYHVLFFYLPFQNFSRGLILLTFNSFILSRILKQETFLFKSYIKYWFSSLKRFFILLVSLILLHFMVYLYYSKYFIHFSTPQFIKEHPKQKYYICANLYNNENIMEDWITQMKYLISYLGTTNVYISIFENGDSKDLTAAYLNNFTIYLNQLNIPNRIVTTPQILKRGVERIAFLSRIRNKAMEFLYEIPDLDWNSTTIIFFNDIIYNYQDIVNLLSTNNGDYDAVCGMDFYESFYDTWVGIDLNAEEFRHYYPFFMNKVMQDAYINGETVRTFSCWNGVIAVKAKPFENKNITFRTGRIRASECTLIHADLYTNGYGKSLVNTNLIFAYEYGYYYKNKYVYPWTKNLVTYFYYYFVYGFQKKNWSMVDLTSKMANFSHALQIIYHMFYMK